MRKAAKQIIVCAIGLLLFCILCRFTLFRTYTMQIPVPERQIARFAESRIPPTAQMDGPEIARVGEIRVHSNHISVPIRAEHAGEADLLILDDQGEEIAYAPFRITPVGTVIDLSTGGFTGDTAVLMAVTLFWFAVSAIMIWHYFQGKGAAYYTYYSIYYSGFSLFALVTAILMLRITIMHILYPGEYNMFAAYSTINGASSQFMVLTMPAVILFAAAMAVSNIELLRHERRRVWNNTLGLIVSGLFIIGEAIGICLFSRDFSGSEAEYRIWNTLENVYATIFVYGECMLAGSVVCGITAARRKPALDNDFIVILGCWFRRDGSLPPLLKGRVDQAVALWNMQKELQGKEAILIPSGGQGKDESMPESEAMRRYLIREGFSPDLIRPETESENTFQNMAFSKKIIDQINPDGKVAFVTTNYHVFRSGIWAGQAGLKAVGTGSATKWWYWPNAFMRECAGLLQKRWKQELFLLFLLLVFFGALSMVVG